ncbi:MAG: hypothetical protein Q8M17_06120 [Actinomycetota bacterium]|nr:hypothetical protein [Actinomycetota bacterium]
MDGAGSLRGRVSTRAWALGAAAATALLVAAVVVQILRSGSDPGATAVTRYLPDIDADYLPKAYAAAAVLAAVLVVGVFVRRLAVGTGRALPWAVGALSAIAALAPWWAVHSGAAGMAQSLYRALHVPQGIIPFWDLTLVLQSVDCAADGYDVFAPGNGCLSDAAIYGPGVLWLRFVPLGAFSAAHAEWLGVAAVLLSSLLLVWLARASTGTGQVVLLVAAVGGPWQLLLERGNIDAVVLWGAVASVILVRRWDRLWAWSLAAAIIWLLGTWKYYPFAMGLMLIPALRLRRGWTVLAGYLVAAALFVAITWSNFAFSAESNSGMVDYREVGAMGRIVVVARMIGSVVNPTSLQPGDLLVYAVALAAAAWGAAVALATKRSLRHPAMLAIAGSSMLLASVLLSGFGWGYKATFLLLGVPLVAALVGSRRVVVAASAITVLALIAVVSVVSWNTVLSTIAATVAGAFCFGAAGAYLVRSVLPVRKAQRASTSMT